MHVHIHCVCVYVCLLFVCVVCVCVRACVRACVHVCVCVHAHMRSKIASMFVRTYYALHNVMLTCSSKNTATEYGDCHVARCGFRTTRTSLLYLV